MTTSSAKAVSTKSLTGADAASTAKAAQKKQSEIYASETTNGTTRTAPVTKSSPSKSPLMTTLKEAGHATGTMTGPRTRSSTVTTAAQDKASDTETALAKGVLLCAAGDFAVEEDMFPTDGLCDLLFYTHVRFLENDFQGRYNVKSWKTFRRLAPASRKTGFGMSFSYREADDVRKALNATGRQRLLQLYKEKIQHHGILRATCDPRTLKSDLAGKLKLITELKKFQDELSTSLTAGVGKSELALGIQFTNYQDEAEVAHHPSAMLEMTRRLPITILVVRTHIDRRVGSAPVVGTLVDKFEGSRGKSMNVPTLTSAISSLKAANITGYVKVLLSFTMIVGHFHLNQSFSRPSRPSSTWEAMSWTMDGFQKTCKNNATFDVVGEGTLRYEGIKGTEVFCFEDSFTITEKARLANMDYKLMRSWAVFDAEFEDYKNICGKGSFQRISELKQFLEKFS
ncbi:uncharacterized protein [Dermacentor albipictus]